MHQGVVRRWVTGMGVASMLLLTAGCSGGGGLSGLFDSIFGGGSGDSGSAVFAALDTGTSGFSSGGSTGGGAISSIATINNPEPGSIVLFGSGLAGMAMLRRRKKTQKRTTRSNSD